MNSRLKRNERPQIIAWIVQLEAEFDDITSKYWLKVVIGENGKDSYLEYQHIGTEDGSIRIGFFLH